MKKSFLLCIFTYFYILLHAEECTLPNNVLGECLSISNCPQALEDLKRGVAPKICNSKNSSSIICCQKGITKVDDTKNATFGQISKERCEYFKRVSRYNTSMSQIFGGGGDDAQAKEYSHMAILGYGDLDNVEWNCGGSLISERYVLTAAHCLSSKEYGEVRWVRLGELILNAPLAFDEEEITLAVLNYTKHPDFKPPQKYHDIALIELEYDVTFSEYIKPACLFTEEAIPNDKILVATGWGLLFDGTKPNHLQELKLESFSEEECKKAYPKNNRKLRHGILESQICAGGRERRVDTCEGDSGGPLQIKNIRDRVYTIVGITSFGKICGILGNPGVYTKVYSYVPWIESIVWPDYE